MSNIYRSLLLVIAGATQKELARQVKYLKVENQILRSRLPRQVFVTPKERHRLLKFAGKLSAKVAPGRTARQAQTGISQPRSPQDGSATAPAHLEVRARK